MSRELAARLMTEVRHKQATIDKLTHEMAVLKRLRFAARSEAFTAEQKSLLEEAIEEDLETLVNAASDFPSLVEVNFPTPCDRIVSPAVTR